MPTVTPENHVLLSLLVMVVAFLLAQIIVHPDEESTQEKPGTSPTSALPTH